MPSVIASGMSSVAAVAETGRGYEKGNGVMKGKGKGCDILAGTAETSRATAAVVNLLWGTRGTQVRLQDQQGDWTVSTAASTAAPPAAEGAPAPGADETEATANGNRLAAMQAGIAVVFLKSVSADAVQHIAEDIRDNIGASLVAAIVEHPSIETNNFTIRKLARALIAKPQTHEEDKCFQGYYGNAKGFVNDSCGISLAFFVRKCHLTGTNRLYCGPPIPGNGAFVVQEFLFTSVVLCGAAKLWVGIMWAPQGSEHMDGWPIVAVSLKERGVRVIATNILFTKDHPFMQVLAESFTVNIFQPGADDCCFNMLRPIVEVTETEHDTGGTS